MDTSTYKPKNKSKAVIQAEEEMKELRKLSGEDLAEFDRQKAKAKEERKKRQEQEAHEFNKDWKKKNSDVVKPVFKINDITFGKYFPENSNLTSRVNGETTNVSRNPSTNIPKETNEIFGICSLFTLLLSLCILMYILISSGERNNTTAVVKMILTILFVISIVTFSIFLFNILR